MVDFIIIWFLGLLLSTVLCMSILHIGSMLLNEYDYSINTERLIFINILLWWCMPFILLASLLYKITE